jgi:hypothetical protein
MRTPLALVLAAALGSAAAAQTAPGDCPEQVEAAKAEPATPPAPGAEATAPGNAGSTGWTGGTGGSHIGTTPGEETAASKTWQPPVAIGLDLTVPAGPDC